MAPFKNQIKGSSGMRESSDRALQGVMFWRMWHVKGSQWRNSELSILRGRTHWNELKNHDHCSSISPNTQEVCLCSGSASCEGLSFRKTHTLSPFQRDQMGHSCLPRISWLCYHLSADEPCSFRSYIWITVTFNIVSAVLKAGVEVWGDSRYKAPSINITK